MLDAVSGEDRRLDSIATDTGHTIRGTTWSPSGQWGAVEVENWSAKRYILPSDIRIVPVGGEATERRFSFNSGGEGTLAGWGPA